MSNRYRMKRPKGIRWSYDGDGLFYHERVKGFWKRHWQKWLKRRMKKDDGASAGPAKEGA
jgi:hypothetical protein